MGLVVECCKVLEPLVSATSGPLWVTEAGTHLKHTYTLWQSSIKPGYACSLLPLLLFSRILTSRFFPNKSPNSPSKGEKEKASRFLPRPTRPPPPLLPPVPPASARAAPRAPPAAARRGGSAACRGPRRAPPSAAAAAAAAPAAATARARRPPGKSGAKEGKTRGEETRKDSPGTGRLSS